MSDEASFQEVRLKLAMTNAPRSRDPHAQTEKKTPRRKMPIVFSIMSSEEPRILNSWETWSMIL